MNRVTWQGTATDQAIHDSDHSCMSSLKDGIVQVELGAV